MTQLNQLPTARRRLFNVETSATFFARSTILNFVDRLSFQLYSARRFPPLDSQLATLAGLGFRNVEPYGGLLADGAALKEGLQRHGLQAPSSHVALDRLRTDRDGVAAQARDLGIRYLIVPAIPPEQRPTDAAGWRQLGHELSELQEALARENIPLGWHNHEFEFRPVANGRYPLDLVFEAAPTLFWEADIGWIHAAGEDPLAWLEKYRERIKAVHIKDAAPPGEKADEDGWTNVGEGVIDWRRLLPAIEATGAELLVLEHDNPADFEGFARRSHATIESWA
jgi:sugar phosphate isomerase/epimerase